VTNNQTFYQDKHMHLIVAEELITGDLVCIRTDEKNETRLARWSIGDEAIGITTRHIKMGESVEYIPRQSTNDILVRGSHSPMSGENIVIQVSCDLKVGELVCIRQTGTQAVIDHWGFGDEAVGVAARKIEANEFVNFCAGVSTVDIQVKPNN
jgi:hypothetical protein